MNSSFLELLREEVTRVLRRPGRDRGRHGPAAGGVPPGAPAAHPVRREDDRPRPGRAVGHRALPDAGGPVPGDRRPRPGHGAVPGPAARRDAQALLAREAAGHPPAPLRRLGEDPLPVPPAVLGGGRRASAAGARSPTSRSAPSTTRTTAARPAAASCWRATRGRRTPSAGARSRRPTASPRRSRTSPPSTRRSTQEFEVGVSYMWHHDEFAGGAFALFDPGQQTRLYEAIVAAGGADPLRRRARLAAPTPGSRARSSPASAPRSRSTWTGSGPD